MKVELTLMPSTDRSARAHGLPDRQALDESPSRPSAPNSRSLTVANSSASRGPPSARAGDQLGRPSRPPAGRQPAIHRIACQACRSSSSAGARPSTLRSRSDASNRPFQVGWLASTGRALTVLTEAGELRALVTPQLAHDPDPLNAPTVGDWVVLEGGCGRGGPPEAERHRPRRRRERRHATGARRQRRQGVRRLLARGAFPRQAPGAPSGARLAEWRRARSSC